jgi:copper chaperone
MMKKIILDIKGMHCKSCEILIKEALEDSGVKVDVSLKTGKANVEFDDKKITESKIKEIIKKEGYEVK